MNRRYPAYGKQLMAMRQSGHAPDGVYVVFDWDLARAFPHVVVADDLPTDQLELRYLAGLDVTLAYREKHSSRVPALAEAILETQPHILNALAVDIPQNFILKNIAGEVFA
ncbi:MAG: hypothetical protein WAW75_05060 [Gallionella sp.]